MAAKRTLSSRSRGTDSEEKRYRKSVQKRLDELSPILARAAIGDFSKNVPFRKREDEFSELYAGLQVMIDVIRETVAEQHSVNQHLEYLIKKRTAALNEAQRIATVGSWEWDIPARTVFWSDELCRLAGRSTTHFRTGFTEFLDYVHPNDRRAVRQAIDAARKRQSICDVEYRLCRPSGGERAVYSRIKSIVSEGRKTIRILGTVQDITERKTAQAVQSELALLVESSADAIIGMDLDGTVTSWNAAAERIYGYAPRDIIGQPITRLTPQELADEEIGILSQIKRNQRVENFETKRRRKDGQFIDVSLTASPVHSARRRVVGAVTVARDITKQKELYLRQQQFVSVASHELRTPITALIGYLTLVRQDPDGDPVQNRHFLDRASQAANRLSELVEDLLHVARIEEERLAFKVRPVRPGQVVAEVVEHFKTTAGQRNHKLVVKDTLRPTDRIKVDPSKLRQVIDNLLTNAIKYTPSGGTVTISTRKTTKEIVITVSDTGIGIHPDNLQRIYERFFREYTELSVSAGGTGLGLYISKQLVDRQGGKLNISSKHGRGTVASVRFPRLLPKTKRVRPR